MVLIFPCSWICQLVFAGGTQHGLPVHATGGGVAAPAGAVVSARAGTSAPSADHASPISHVARLLVRPTGSPCSVCAEGQDATAGRVRTGRNASTQQIVNAASRQRASRGRARAGGRRSRAARATLVTALQLSGSTIGTRSSTTRAVRRRDGQMRVGRSAPEQQEDRPRQQQEVVADPEQRHEHGQHRERDRELGAVAAGLEARDPGDRPRADREQREPADERDRRTRGGGRWRERPRCTPSIRNGDPMLRLRRLARHLEVVAERIDERADTARVVDERHGDDERDRGRDRDARRGRRGHAAGTSARSRGAHRTSAWPARPTRPVTARAGCVRRAAEREVAGEHDEQCRLAVAQVELAGTAQEQERCRARTSRPRALGSRRVAATHPRAPASTRGSRPK